jgi:uncharacterized protein (DUF1800 family)
MAERKISRRQFFSPSPSFTSPRVIQVKKLTDKQETPIVSNVEFTLIGDLKPYSGSWGADQACHLLRRMTFGVTKKQLDQVLAFKSAISAVDFALTVKRNAPSPPINNYNRSTGDNPIKDPNVALGQTWVNAKSPNDSDIEFCRIESWRGWWLDRMIQSDFNLTEKMTLFWHNHFSTKTNVFNARALYVHNSLLRKYALGNFKALVKAVTLDPQMLYFLNGAENEKSAPDENYARELQELFTVGKDSTSQYQEMDVVAAARVLTGWRVNEGDNALSVYLDKEAHDTNDKQFSKFYNNALIVGNQDAEVELDTLLDLIFKRPEVSLHICRKIYRFFVYYKINAEIESTIIEPLAKILRDNNFEILPVLKTLFKSEHFFDALNKGCFIKTPVDLVAGLMRNFNLTVPGTPFLNQWDLLNALNYRCSDMAMIIGDPPNVAGWQAFRQSPIYYRMWITGDTIRVRSQFIDNIILDAIYTGDTQISVDHLAFAKQFDHPEDPNLLIEDLLKLLTPIPFSKAKKVFLKNILLSGERTDDYWTTAWNAYIANPNDEMAADTVKSRFTQLLRYLLNLPEYQLS